MAYRRSCRRNARPYRRLRFARRRRTFRRTGMKRTRYADPGGAHVNFAGYKKKRFNKLRWQRQLWNASNVSTHYRSILATSGTLTTVANTVVTSYALVPLVSNLFWTTSGGAQDSIGVGANARIFIRGGVSHLRLGITTGATTNVRVWCLRTTANGQTAVTTTPTNPGDILSPNSFAWDPTNLYDFFKYYKVWKTWETVVNSLSAISFKTKVLSQKIDTDQFSDGSARDFYLIGATSATGVASTLSITYSDNISFSVDTT